MISNRILLFLSTALLCFTHTFHQHAVQAVEIVVQAGSPETPIRKCVSQFVSPETHITGTVTANPVQGQILDIEVVDSAGNQYWKKNAFTGTQKFVLTTHSHVEVSYCFVNRLEKGFPLNDKNPPNRPVKLIIDVVDAEFSDDKATGEKLAPIEAELKRAEGIIQEIHRSMQGYVDKEIGLRDINESTNERVKNFGIYSMVLLVVCGGWEIWYLYSFFRAKQII